MMKIVSLLQDGGRGKKIFVLTFALGIVPAVSVSLAQELPPELAAPAAQHKTAVEALDKQKLEAVALAAKSYMSALDSVEKAATAKGEVDLVAAVVKEREAVASGALEPSLPEALPKTKLRMSRKTLLASVERISADFAKRKKAADADYLRALATLQTKATTNPELAKQITAEKDALLGGVVALGNNASAAKASRGKNFVVNGDFETVVEGKPDGWDLANGIVSKTENNNTFLRFDNPVKYENGTADTFHAKQTFRVPEHSTKVSLSVRIRAENAKIVPNKHVAQMQIKFLDNNNAEISVTGTLWDGKNGGWKTVYKDSMMPRNAVEAVVRLSNGKCPGQIDFDDVEVTFK